MRISSALSAALLSSLVSARGFDCKDISVGGYKYDLSPLGGVHTLYHVNETEASVVNTTYVLNICGILKGAANRDGMKCGTSKNSTCCPVPGYSQPVSRNDLVEPRSALKLI